MGVVYEAEQISLNRRVALKILPFAATMDPRQLQRFHHEAQAAAMLHHQHIVPVYGVGCERGVHYYAMQLIEGHSLAAVIAELRGNAPGMQPEVPAPTIGEAEARRMAATPPAAALSTRPTRRDRNHYCRLVELVAHTADALEYAHSMGVVHRDIKPANLLLDAGGHLWVTDFGLAKTNSSENLTVSGDLIGTLRYMSPEQALARHGLVDHRTDVYSLGATLYELLTLRPAVEGADKREILRKIAFEEPTAPRKLEKSIPAELETITLMAISKNPNERYATSGEMAEDLRHFLADQPIRARRPTARQQVARLARRHPAATAAAGLAAGLLIAGWWGWHQQRTQTESTARAVMHEAASLQAAGRYPEALAVTRRAEDLLPRYGGDKALRSQIAERAADLTLLIELEEITLEQYAHVRDNAFDMMRGGPLLRQAFLDYGVDIVGESETAIVVALEKRAIRAEIVSALDEWSALLGQPREKLMRIAQALDREGGVSRVRQVHIDREKKLVLMKRLALDVAVRGTALEIYHLAELLSSEGQHSETERLVRAGLSRFPNSIRMNFFLGMLLTETPPANTQQIPPERLEEGLGYFRVALALRPHAPGSWQNVGSTLSQLGRYEESAAAFQRAIELNPGYSDAQAGLGIVLQKLGRLDDAVGSLKKALELQPKDVTVHSTLASVLIQKGQFDSAIQSLQSALEFRPNNADAYEELGYALNMKDQYDQAIDALQKALKYGKPNPRIYFILGSAHDHKGQWEMAIKLYKRAIEMEPNHTPALNNLAALLADCDDPKFRKPTEAVRYARRAVEHGNDYGQQPYVKIGTLGRSLFRAGEWGPAVVALEKNREMTNGEYYYHTFFLAMAHWKSGNHEQAKKYYAQAVALMDQSNPKDSHTLRIRREADELIGIPTRKNSRPTSNDK